MGPEPGHDDWVTGLKSHDKNSSSLLSAGADGKLGLWHLNAKGKVSSDFKFPLKESEGKLCDVILVWQSQPDIINAIVIKIA